MAGWHADLSWGPAAGCVAHGSELGARKAGWVGLSRNIDYEFLKHQGGMIPWEIILKYAEDLVGDTIRDQDEKEVAVRSTENGVEIFVKLDARKSTQSKCGMGKVMYARPAAHVGRQMTSWGARHRSAGRAPGLDTENTGPRRRDRRGPAQRALGEGRRALPMQCRPRQKPRARHTERRVAASDGARHEAYRERGPTQRPPTPRHRPQQA